jgi:8-amino-7-oxononanoate synthase
MTINDIVTRELAALSREHRYRELVCPEKLRFSHNDYLGLSRHPEILHAAELAAKHGPGGSGASRLLGGNSELMEETETAISAFFGSPAALLFSSGYLANLAIVRAIGNFVDGIITDERNHASLVDAINLTGKPRRLIGHNDWKRLDLPSDRKWLLVTESLFSMDGDVADWQQLRQVHARTNSFLVVDEAHAAGVFGEDGRGLVMPTLNWERGAAVVTFGKAFGVSGAAVLCSRTIREWLINSARSFMFTTAPSPIVVSMIRASLNIVGKEVWRRKELWERALSVRQRLKTNIPSAMMDTKGSSWNMASPIIPFLIPGTDEVLEFSECMRKRGFDLKAIRYPTVPIGGERLRIALSLGASWEETEQMIEELIEQWAIWMESKKLASHPSTLLH